MRIQKLDDDLVSKIAAGEVIERPFSVIKELVENALDADATHIDIEVEQGGRKKMVVLDNGHGMSREEALLALERHATSKIKTAEDLFQINTLGFRGEAMPSIASVSQMTLETKARDDGPQAIATRLELSGVKLMTTTSCSLPEGTRITIENLFFNTPARLKFLKTPETEFSHIASWVESMALGRPDVAWSLRHNGKMEWQTPKIASDNPLKERMAQVLGMDVVEWMHPVNKQRNRLSIHGFVADHRAGSRNAKSIYLYVNGRMVRDRTLQHAITSAYENHLMKHQYPWVVLFLEVPPDFVDVNVHPAKTEVRFANSSIVHEFVRSAVREALVPANPVAHTSESIGGSPFAGFDFTAMRPREESVSSIPQEILSLPFQSSRSFVAERAPSESHVHSPGESRHESHSGVAATLDVLNQVRVLGQVHQTYLVCETSESLVLIDQHAAHERLGYEALRLQWEKGPMEVQHLLVPYHLDLLPSQGEILKQYHDGLASLGLDVDHFGGPTYLVRSIPTLLVGTDIRELLEDLVESLQKYEKLTPFEERIHEVLERMACHHQVRAGDKLSSEEIQHLIAEMKKNPHANQCPHGRPTVLELRFSEVEKLFRRRV